MNYRYRLAPVALTVERPVLHLVLNAAFSDAETLKLLDSAAGRSLFIGKAVKETGIDHLAVAGIGFLFNISALYYLDNINSELMRKLPVAGIVSRNRHYGAGTVAHHNIV